MKKYKPANLQSVKEFIQRMLDGEAFYCGGNGYTYHFNGMDFCAVSGEGRVNKFIPSEAICIHTFQIQTPYTIQDAIAEKPRLCWVWSNNKNMKQLIIIYDYMEDTNYPFVGEYQQHKHAELATLEEIKQYLED